MKRGDEPGRSTSRSMDGQAIRLGPLSGPAARPFPGRAGRRHGRRAEASGVFRADSVLAKHDETYMPREVADALRRQGHWQGEEKVSQQAQQ